MPAEPTRRGGVIAGAIRWDAWYANTGVARQAQDTLSYAPWQSRAPWFAKVEAPNHLTSVGSQADLDEECRLAASAGLSYWAFDMYMPNSPMSVAWHLYQSSRFRHLIAWCGIIGPGFLGSVPYAQTEVLEAKVDLWVKYFAQPNYQLVEGTRPLLYVLWSEYELNWYFDEHLSNFAKSIVYLRSKCSLARVGDPYVVIMAGKATTSAGILRQAGADAISNYIPDMGPTPAKAVPWEILDSRMQLFWKSLAEQGVECIPIFTTGWDTRARRAHPENPTTIPNHETLQQYFVLPTASQLQASLSDAIIFVQSHPVPCRSKALLIYSWDECDEGGNPIIPTHGHGKPDKANLDAVAATLKS